MGYLAPGLKPAGFTTQPCTSSPFQPGKVKLSGVLISTPPSLSASKRLSWVAAPPAAAVR